MSEARKLMDLPVKIKVGDLELNVRPFSIDDLELFAVDDKDPIEKQMRVVKEMVTKVLKEAIPDITDEEIKSISIRRFNELVTKIMEINDMGNKYVPSALKK